MTKQDHIEVLFECMASLKKCDVRMLSEHPESYLNVFGERFEIYEMVQEILELIRMDDEFESTELLLQV